MDVTHLLRVWLLVSLVALAAAGAWAFAPILIPLVLVGALLAAVCRLAIALARGIERRRATRPGTGSPPEAPRSGRHP